MSAYLTVFHLPLEADFASLLPADAPSVRDAERLAERMPAQDTMLMLVVAPDPASREAAGAKAIAGVEKLGSDLVQRVEGDDHELREYVGANRFLFIALEDLELARRTLEEEVAQAKARANPMFIDLDDAPRDPRRLDELRAKQRAGEAQLAKRSHVSAGGHTQVLVIRTAFRGTDVEKDLRMMGELEALASSIRQAHPSVTIGFAGGPAVTVAEHDALTRGMVMSSLITLVLVALVLLTYLRSVRILILLTANILAATLIAFGVAAVTVGHLNAATAFLGAIIAGNGVNYGILLVARFLEERRTKPMEVALAAAIGGTLRPTLVASLGAAIAYGALGATEFRGFADFALIGGAGMLVCWIASYVMLPLLLLRFAKTSTRQPSRLFGRAVVAAFGFKRPIVALVVAGGLSLGAIAVTAHYIADDPFEYDLPKLRSQAPDAVAARGWLKLSDVTFGRGLAGLAGQTFIAVDRADQVPAVVDALAELRTREPIVGPTRSILDVVPRDQPAKLAELAAIRKTMDDAGIDDAQLASLRPPDGLREITAKDLPASVAVRLTERDGRIGHIVAVKPGESFDERNGRDLIKFADAVRQIRLANGDTVSTAGALVMFADVLVQIQKDGPLITGIAAVGLVVMVLLVVGRTRRSYAVLAASAAGTIGMVAVCALYGLKVNFLDFVALPITLGLGIDYAINVADRAAVDDPMLALRSTGGTVLVCSLTTMIGYASLLVSDNMAIQGFGLASLIGEITCVAAAFVIVPAMVSVRRSEPVASYSSASITLV
ncbi:MAG: MMPL family transporter [Deltaproteobacteria bacterium]|nr:MMPL family transporter [Deltaproteobacteria bacterium]